MTSSGSSNFPVVLWDGTTVIASDYVTSAGGSGFFASSCLSGVITSPAGNLRMSATNNTLKTGTIQFNASGLNADSYIVAVRIG
jgi:hypothetical protein